MHVSRVRDIEYLSDSDYTVRHYDKTYDLEKIVRVWFVVELFSDWRGPAHTLLSFEFEGPEFVAISVEIRKEKGESYSVLKGLYRQYELMYVVADENDALKLRTNFRKDRVYLYPVNASKEDVSSLFVDMLERANKLHRTPEFYNSLLNTCTTNIVLHINRIATKPLPFSYKVLLPGYSDRLAYDVGLIDTELPFEQARTHFRIDPVAQELSEGSNFSVEIRRKLPGQ